MATTTSATAAHPPRPTTAAKRNGSVPHQPVVAVAGPPPDPAPHTPRPSRWPTNKWLAGVITSFTAFVSNWIMTGHLTKELWVAFVGVVSGAMLAYLIPNHPTPGGVPHRAK